MKTQFKNHIKFDTCWYDKFFKVNNRQRNYHSQSRDSTAKNNPDTGKIKTEKNENK